jgi:hypothetical protein
MGDPSRERAAQACVSDNDFVGIHEKRTRARRQTVRGESPAAALRGVKKVLQAVSADRHQSEGKDDGRYRDDVVSPVHGICSLQANRRFPKFDVRATDLRRPVA